MSAPIAARRAARYTPVPDRREREWSCVQDRAPGACVRPFRLRRWTLFPANRSFNSSIRKLSDRIWASMPFTSGWALFRFLSRRRSIRIASRATSETLRAPLDMHRFTSAEYSSSDSRTLIMRERTFMTFIENLQKMILGSFGLKPVAERHHKKGESRNALSILSPLRRLRPFRSHLPWSD